MGEKSVLRRHRLRCAVLLYLTLCLVGCVTAPPYQEMSDARQAIAVAQEAGAAQKSPELYAEAIAYLSNAKEKMENRSFNIARSQAVLAREKAIEAARQVRRQEQP